jgi:hypothetical protein
MIATGPYSEPGEFNPHTYYLFMIHFNIILPLHLCLQCDNIQSTIFDWNFVCISKLTNVYYMFRPIHPLWFDHPDTWWRVRTMKHSDLLNILNFYSYLRGKDHSDTNFDWCKTELARKLDFQMKPGTLCRKVYEFDHIVTEDVVRYIVLPSSYYPLFSSREVSQFSDRRPI